MSSPIDYLLGELNDQGQLVGLDKGLKRFFGQLTIEGIASLIKLQRKQKHYSCKYYPPGVTSSLPVNTGHRFPRQSTLKSPGNPQQTEETFIGC